MQEWEDASRGEVCRAEGMLQVRASMLVRVRGSGPELGWFHVRARMCRQFDLIMS